MSHQKKNLLRALAAALALALCAAGAVMIPESREAAYAEEELEIVSSYPYTTVTKDKVNLRKGRGTKTEKITTIPAGAEIIVKSKEGNWAEVEYSKYTGYVHCDYIVLKTVKKIKETPTPTPVPTLSPEEDAGGYTVLKKGSIGKEVRSLQEAMIELGYLNGTADGNFGDATEKAVIAFQQKNQYPDTGLADANLQAFLYSGKPLNAKGTATKITTVSPAAGATMKAGSTGALVGELQQRLKALGYYKGETTDKYDTATKNAVAAFQKKNNLKADGVAGAATRALLDSAEALPADATPTPEITATPTPTAAPTFIIPSGKVESGSKGDDAKNVQNRLKELGYYRGEVDGVFGRASVNALKSFQTNNGLKADGIAGKDTYEKLYSYGAVPFSVPETPTPTPAPTETPAPTGSAWATLRAGSSGNDVKQLQENLIQLGYLTGKADGVYGDKTVAAVRAFQKANNLTEDGTAGAATLKAVYSGTAKKAEKTAEPTATATTKPTPTPKPTTLSKGSTGNAVKELQKRLISLGYLSGKADGVFGSDTTSALKAFQKDNKLTADGVAGEKTLAKLESASATDTPKPAATATPAPTAVPGAQAALAGKPNASNVIYANWYTTVKDVCKRYPYATVYDYSTGISWQVHIFSVGAHADCEPLTANDTTKMVKAFGGEKTWNPKAVWVIFADGSVYMASTHDNPHGTSHITDNNFGGHMCIHFPRTQEQVTAIGTYATSHQETIDAGWAATRKMAN